ncbi:MAG TPA: hypothetical protein VLX92_12060 [Kofleriaceae bacterium]|nr:hypothetical protein [Kofleriaceae bacterium]
MVIGELDEVDYDLEVDGEQVREQLARKVWERAGWATVAIAFRERASDGSWKPTRLAVLRFRRVRDAWQRQAAITLPASDAVALIDALADWRGMFDPAD